jgi:hypothetical protein
MLRIAAIELLLFALPFLVFAAWLVIRHKLRDSEAIQAAMPMAKLTVVGFILVIVGLGALATFHRSGPEGTYRPATIEDGKIKPGRIE